MCWPAGLTWSPPRRHDARCLTQPVIRSYVRRLKTQPVFSSDEQEWWMKLPVTRFTQVHEGGSPVELYLTVLTMDQLMERAKVDIRKPGATTGYQREPTESRVREIARYVTTQ